MNPSPPVPSADLVGPAIEQVIHTRRSALAFADRDIDDQVLARLFDAARWSASSSNEQPWRFLVVMRRDEAAFASLVSALAPGNAAWAARAPVLVLTAARREFESRPRPNRHAGYDLGQSAATLTLTAAAFGLATHQMAGFDPDLARQLFTIPDEFELYSVIALGHPGEIESLSEALVTRARATPTRRSLESVVWSGAWGTPAAFAQRGPRD